MARLGRRGVGGSAFSVYVLVVDARFRANLTRNGKGEWDVALTKSGYKFIDEPFLNDLDIIDVFEIDGPFLNPF